MLNMQITATALAATASTTTNAAATTTNTCQYLKHLLLREQTGWSGAAEIAQFTVNNCRVNSSFLDMHFHYSICIHGHIVSSTLRMTNMTEFLSLTYTPLHRCSELMCELCYFLCSGI